MINVGPVPNRSDPAIARMAQAAEAHRLDLDGDPNVAGDAFVRYWPPNPQPGTAPDGNTAGFLRYLTRNPSAPLQCDCQGGFSLTLDRSATAPSAMIGVAFLSPSPYRSNWLWMFPGDTIYVPGGFDRFWIYNADLLDQSIGGLPAAASRGLGYCAFLIGTRRNGLAPSQVSPHPYMRLIGCSLASTFSTVPLGRCTQVVIQAGAMQAGNTASAAGNATLSLSIDLLMRRVALATAITGTSLDSETLDAFPSGTFAETQATVRSRRIQIVNGRGTSRIAAPAGMDLYVYNADFKTWSVPVMTDAILYFYGYGEGR
jgi:hypothetical protein